MSRLICLCCACFVLLVAERPKTSRSWYRLVFHVASERATRPTRVSAFLLSRPTFVSTYGLVVLRLMLRTFILDLNSFQMLLLNEFTTHNSTYYYLSSDYAPIFKLRQQATHSFHLRRQENVAVLGYVITSTLGLCRHIYY